MSDEFENEGRATGFVTGLLIGAVVGAGVALLFAPDSGRETRRRLSRRIRALREKAGDEAEAIGDEIRVRGRRVRREMARAADAVRAELDGLR